VPWVEAFAVFVVSHLAGDFLLQTDWQARNKAGGLGRDHTARRALVAHMTTYTLAFVPAVAWLWSEIGAVALAIAAVIVVPHLVQDDGRPVRWFMTRVKHSEDPGDMLLVAVDQSLHVLALFGAALLAAAAA
jgi:hypothetical protein